MGELSRTFHVATSSISRKAKKEGWDKLSMQQLIDEKVRVAMDSMAIDKKTQHLDNFDHIAIELEAKKRLELIGLFDNAALMNQKGANTLFN